MNCCSLVRLEKCSGTAPQQVFGEGTTLDALVSSSRIQPAQNRVASIRIERRFVQLILVLSRRNFQLSSALHSPNSSTMARTKQTGTVLATSTVSPSRD